MFIPEAFKEENLETIKQFIASHPQATVVAQVSSHDVNSHKGNSSLEACHIPMYWQDDHSELGYLVGHIAKMNPLNNSANLDKDWLIIFQDAGHYISPNWYPSKSITHKEVPTWNYRSVHVTGQVSLLTEQETLINILTRLTTDFEASQPKPWSLNDAPEPYIQSMCRAIVGIRVAITDIQAQFKLSQNKSAENKVGIVAGLRQLNTVKADEMATLVKPY